MRLPIMLALLLVLGCAATQLSPSSGLEETLRVYSHSKGKKALVECSKNAERSGVQATCYLFATGDEAAPSTLRGCAEGRIGAKRCALQEQYPLGGD